MKLVLCIALLASPFVVEGMTLPRSWWQHQGYGGNPPWLNQLGSFGNHGNFNQHGSFGNTNQLGSLDGHSQSGNFGHSDRAAVRNMPVELFSSDVGALDFSGPALDSGAVDGRYWFFSQAAPVLTTHNKVDFLSKKTAGKDRKKKAEKTEKRTRTVKYPMMRKTKMMRSEGNIVAPVGGHAMVGQLDQSFGQVGQIDHAQVVPEGRWGFGRSSGYGKSSGYGRYGGY